MPREAPYLATAEALRARIVAGEWRLGDRLPSRARLAEEYGVGRNVVQRAVDLLIADGLLEGRAGSGTYVGVPRERLRMVRSRRRERSLAALTERGRAGAWDAHSEARVPAPEHIADRLAVVTPDRLLGRMNATARFVSWGGIPLGGLLGGTSGSALGPTATLWIGATGMTLSALPFSRVAEPAHRP